MGLLDTLTALTKGTAAARAGYLTGEDEEQDKQKRDALTALQLTRQSRVDALSEQRAAAEERRANAQADWYEKRDTTPRAQPPHTVNTDQGIMQWDAASGKFVPTGMQAPERASDRAAGRIEGREHRIAMGQEVSDANRQISDTQRDLKDEEGPYGDADPSRINQLKGRITDFTRGRDSTVAARKSPVFEATPRTAGPGVVPFDPVMPGSRVDRLRSTTPALATPDASKAAYDNAAARYKRALAAGVPQAEAQQAYDATVAGIARQAKQLPQEDR